MAYEIAIEAYEIFTEAVQYLQTQQICVTTRSITHLMLERIDVVLSQ